MIAVRRSLPGSAPTRAMPTGGRRAWRGSRAPFQGRYAMASVKQLEQKVERLTAKKKKLKEEADTVTADLKAAKEELTTAKAAAKAGGGAAKPKAKGGNGSPS